MEIEDDSNVERDDDDVDSWETEESSISVLANATSSTSEGPLSFRSISVKSDDGGGSFWSLSRIEGFGCDTRRQLAATLDEFWEQLYDFHGQAIQVAKGKKIEVFWGWEYIHNSPLPCIKWMHVEKTIQGQYQLQLMIVMILYLKT